MAIDNLIDLVELLTELDDAEHDLNLVDGQVYASDGSIVTL